MTEKQSDDIALKVVAKLKEGKAFRGCPLTRDEQVAVKEVAAMTKKGKKWFNIVIVALLMLAAKDIYHLLKAGWLAVTK